jgi:hypothetical protein
MDATIHLELRDLTISASLAQRTDFHFARTVLFGWLNDARRDLIYCAQNNRLHEWPHALRIRWQQRRARLAGFMDGWKIYRENETDGRTHPPTWIEREPVG